MSFHQGSHKLWQTLPDRVCYADDFDQAGFHRVHLPDFTHWNKIHKWCKAQFGDNYTWTGSQFWFCTPEDAAVFTLTWC